MKSAGLFADGNAKSTRVLCHEWACDSAHESGYWLLSEWCFALLKSRRSHSTRRVHDVSWCFFIEDSRNGCQKACLAWDGERDYKIGVAHFEIDESRNQIEPHILN